MYDDVIVQRADFSMTGSSQDETSLRKIMEIMRDGVVVIQDEEITMVNEAFAEMLGFEKKDLIASEFEDLVDSVSRRRDQEVIEALVTGKDARKFNTRLMSGSGQALQVEVNPTLLELEGKPAVVAAVRNLTGSLELESAVTELENRFANLYDMSPVAYFTINREGTIEQVNAAAGELLGCSSSDIVGRSLSDFMPKPESAYDPASDIIREAVRGKMVTNLELEMVCPNGRSIWASISSRPLTTGTGIMTEIGLTAIDVTRRRMVEERLRAESQRANLYMEVMTQDLNLVNQNVLFALEDLSISVALPERLKSVLSETSWSLRRAARMIANMGVLISLDQEPPAKTKTALKSHFDKAVREATRDFAWKTITVKSTLPKKPLYVSGHAFMWYAFFNIIHHSASADTSENVKIDLKASLDESGDMIRIELLDRSPGIRDEIKSDIFRRDGAAHDQLQGSGLGLTVVDRYISDLGGQIWVEDRVKGRPSRGSKFVLLLPVWREEVAIPTILYYKSEHCVFCTPVLDSLYIVLRDLGIGPSAIEIVNVDDPDSGVKEGDLPALPTIRLGSSELAGFQSEEDLRSAITSMILMSGKSGV
jgi:PAS domain S-box-containing protein